MSKRKKTKRVGRLKHEQWQVKKARMSENGSSPLPVERLRELLTKVTWGNFIRRHAYGGPNNKAMYRINNVTFRARAGIFLGRPVKAIIAHKQFVVIEKLYSGVMYSLRIGSLTPLDPRRKHTGVPLSNSHIDSEVYATKVLAKVQEQPHEGK